MAQHDNGRRPGGTQAGAWQQGQHRDQQDYSGAQQDQSSGGRYGGQQGGGQHEQYDQGRHQQGDNWRERQGPAAGGWRPAMEERDRQWSDRGGQGSFGGQASDNDYGNRGITESGNFGNYGQGRQDLGSYRHGYDARSDSPGGYGGDWNAQRAWRDDQRVRHWQGSGQTYGQSSADNYQGSRGWQGTPGNQDRYGDNGYQGNFQQGQRGQAYHDPDYHQWRGEQLSKLDRDYDEWRQHRYQRFADEFDQWRSSRGGQQGATQADATNSSDKGKSGDASSKK